MPHYRTQAYSYFVTMPLAPAVGNTGFYGAKFTENNRNAAREATPGKGSPLANRRCSRNGRWSETTVSVTRCSASPARSTTSATTPRPLPSTSNSSIKSGEVLGSVQCNSADPKPARLKPPNCIRDGKYGKYKTVTAEARS